MAKGIGTGCFVLTDDSTRLKKKKENEGEVSYETSKQEEKVSS